MLQNEARRVRAVFINPGVMTHQLRLMSESFLCLAWLQSSLLPNSIYNLQSVLRKVKVNVSALTRQWTFGLFWWGDIFMQQTVPFQTAELVQLCCKRLCFVFTWHCSQQDIQICFSNHNLEWHVCDHFNRMCVAIFSSFQICYKFKIQLRSVRYDDTRPTERLECVHDPSLRGDRLHRASVHILSVAILGSDTQTSHCCCSVLFQRLP